MNTSIEYIEHSAIVLKVDKLNGKLKVRIDDQDECGNCPAEKVCGFNGEPSNEISIATPDASLYKPGDIITIRGTERMHKKAIMLATVFPCIILIAVMIGLYLLTKSQLAAALAGLGSTFFFYFILWLCKDKIAHEFVFTITGTIERAGDRL